MNMRTLRPVLVGHLRHVIKLGIGSDQISSGCIDSEGRLLYIYIDQRSRRLRMSWENIISLRF